MILASHAIIGAAAARLVPDNPYLGFFLAVASHFVADAIPHWAYSISSIIEDKGVKAKNKFWNYAFLSDILKIGFDIATGTIISLLVFKAYGANDSYAVFLGIFGGILPDGLQFLYFKIRKEPLISIQKFHIEIIHAKSAINDPYLGVFSQMVIVAIAVIISLFLRH